MWKCKKCENINSEKNELCFICGYKFVRISESELASNRMPHIIPRSMDYSSVLEEKTVATGSLNAEDYPVKTYTESLITTPLNAKSYSDDISSDYTRNLRMKNHETEVLKNKEELKVSEMTSQEIKPIMKDSPYEYDIYPKKRRINEMFSKIFIPLIVIIPIILFLIVIISAASMIRR